MANNDVYNPRKLVENSMALAQLSSLSKEHHQ
jgi:hypothetical protein